MEFRDRGVNHQDSPRIPQIYRCFTDKTYRADIMGLDFQDHLHSLRGNPFHHSLSSPNPHDLHETIEREIEKERIREEIIVSEIARRRVLEAEVRRELMMERESAPPRTSGGGDGFSFRSSPQIEFVSRSHLGARAEERTLEERVPTTLPFQRVSEVKPVSGGPHEKQKVIFLGKPDENISGTKRKVVSPSGVDAIDILSSKVVKKKKPKKEDWSCSICKINCTSERALNDHLRGRKHKLKEAALRAEKSGKGTTTVDASVDQEEKGDPKNRNFPFWCDMCKVGAYSVIVMSDHVKGKKHVNRLSRSYQNNGGAGQSHSAKISALMNHLAEWVAGDGKNINEGSNVDETANDELVSPVEPENHEVVDRTEPDNDKAVEDIITEGSNVDETTIDELVNPVEPGNHELVDTAESENGNLVEEIITEGENITKARNVAETTTDELVNLVEPENDRLVDTSETENGKLVEEDIFTEGNVDETANDEPVNPVDPEHDELVDTTEPESHEPAEDISKGENITEGNVDETTNDESLNPVKKTENDKLVDKAELENHKLVEDMMEDYDWAAYITEPEYGVTYGIVEHEDDGDTIIS